jgi:hypothetical protein
MALSFKTPARAAPQDEVSDLMMRSAFSRVSNHGHAGCGRLRANRKSSSGHVFSHSSEYEARHSRKRSLALLDVRRIYRETAMSTSFDSHKPADRGKGEVGMLWLFAVTTILVLTIAAFVGIVF